MFFFWLIGVAISGLVIGALARLALPGKDDMSIAATILLGVAGSLVGFVLAFVLPGDNYGLSGLIFGVVGAVILLAIYRQSRKPELRA